MEPKTYRTGDHEPHMSGAQSKDMDTILSECVNSMVTVYYT